MKHGADWPCLLIDVTFPSPSERFLAVTGATLDFVLTFQLVVVIIIALFVAYNVFHYILFLLVTQPKDACKIGHELNEFEQRQLIEWTPQPIDFLKHDDEKRTYDDVFGT